MSYLLTPSHVHMSHTSLAAIASSHKCSVGSGELQSHNSSAQQLCTFTVTASVHKGFFLPKKSCAEEHAKVGVRHASSSPCAAGEAQHEGSGSAPALGLQKPLQKNQQTLQKKPENSQFPFVFLFFITSSPAQVQQGWEPLKYHIIANPGFGGLCGQPREGRCHLLFHTHSNAPEAQSKPGFEHKEPTA